MTLSPTLSRALALAILGALLWAVGALAVAPMVASYQLEQDAIARSGELLQGYQRLGRSRPMLEAQLAEVRKSLSPAGLYLAGASDALIAAELQNRVKAAVEADGGKLNSTQILAAQDEGSFRRVAIRVQMTVTVEPMQKIFYGLESATPYLFIENVDIRRRVAKRRRRKRKNEPAATVPEGESRLTVRFDLYGYARSGES
ncbi:MAG: type II secretion system protein GspM [Alphaproteobacteria bacterium]